MADVIMVISLGDCGSKKSPVGFQWLKQHTYLDTLSRS